MSKLGHDPFSDLALEVPRIGSTLQTDWNGSRLTVARFRSEQPDDVFLKLPRQDAFVIASLVNGHRCNGSASPGVDHGADAYLRAPVTIFDLQAEPSCVIDGPFDCIDTHIPRAALDHLAEELNGAKIATLHAPDGWDTDDPAIRGMKALFARVVERPDESGQLFIDHMVLALLSHVARRYGGAPERPRRSGGLAPWQEARAKDLIADNLSKDISLADIARECGLTVWHFSRAFRQSTGTTPHRWLQACRIDRAKNLLADAEMSLAHIAIACGFSDQSHFTKVFRNMTGGTPGAWRQHVAASR